MDLYRIYVINKDENKRKESMRTICGATFDVLIYGNTLGIFRKHLILTSEKKFLENDSMNQRIRFRFEPSNIKLFVKGHEFYLIYY